MAFASLEGNDDNEPLAEINMVPLIDVMLVLLVIFMITAPMMTHTVKIDLPKTSSQAVQPAPVEPIHLAIDAEGQLFWNQQKVSRDELNQRLRALGGQNDAREAHIRADRNVAYHFIAETLADAARAGVSRIGFVSEAEDD